MLLMPEHRLLSNKMTLKTSQIHFTINFFRTNHFWKKIVYYITKDNFL